MSRLRRSNGVDVHREDTGRGSERIGEGSQVLCNHHMPDADVCADVQHGGLDFCVYQWQIARKLTVFFGRRVYARLTEQALPRNPPKYRDRSATTSGEQDFNTQ